MSLPIIQQQTVTHRPAKRGKAKSKKVEVVTPLLYSQGTKQERLQELYNQWFDCKRCDLCTFKADPTKPDIVFGEGNPETCDILVVGEAPGEEEEASSIPFVGNSGQLLNQVLAITSDDTQIREFHADYVKQPKTGSRGEAAKEHFHKQMVEWRYNRFFITNAVGCRPPENRTPTPDEMKACWERLWNIIYIIDPLAIIACGNSALAAVMQKAQVKITQMRGNIYDVEYTGRLGKVTYPVVPTFHPSYLLRKADWKVKGGDWDKTVEDWRKALRVVDWLRNKHYGTPIPQR
jgi:uracil-DNA glycosylase